MEKIFIRPATGLNLYDPAAKIMVPADGIFVERNQYWSRRITEGGAIVFDPKLEAGRVELDRQSIEATQASAAAEAAPAPAAEPTTKSKKQKHST